MRGVGDVMKGKLARFMIGRNGIDQLNLFLLGLDLILLLLASLFRGSAGLLAYLPVFALMAYTYFRMLSRNIARRREENSKYLQTRYKISAAAKIQREKWVQRRDYKFFTCPSCKTTLRVPRGKGKLKIVCRKCGNSFEGKS